MRGALACGIFRGMKKIKLLLVALFILSVGTAALYILYPPFSSRLVSYKRQVLAGFVQNVPTSTHTDDENGFSFEYPKTWRYIEDWDLEYRAKDFVTGVMYQDNPGVACGVIVDNRPSELVYKPNLAIQQLDKTLSENLDDFRSLGGRGFKFKDLPAIDYSYNYTRGGTDIYARLHDYLLYAPDKVYTIICGSRETKYKEFKDDFDLIMRSFEVRG